MDTHRHGLVGRRLGGEVVMAHRHQRIHLGVIGGDAADGQVEGHDGQAADLAMHAVFGVAGEGDDVAIGKPEPVHVVGIDQQDVAAVLEAAQPVAEAVDRRVELVVAADGDEAEPPRRIGEPVGGQLLRHRELGLAGLRLPDAFARRVALVEAAGPEQPAIEVAKGFRIGLLDPVAHDRVVSDPAIPFDFRVCRQRRLGDTRHDRHLGPYMFAGRRASSRRGMDVAQTVFHGDDLGAAFLQILLRAAEAG